MNFSQVLAPLPALPRCEESDGESLAIAGEFVSEQDVARVLLGTTGALPVEGLPVEDFDCFAGRADVRVPASVFIPVSEEEPAPARQPKIHPAFVPLVEEARRAAPPQPAGVTDMEAEYGISRGKASDLWWMMGVGVAVAALLFSGALFDFAGSRDAAAGPMIRPMTAQPVDVAEPAAAAPALASAAHAKEVR